MLLHSCHFLGTRFDIFFKWIDKLQNNLEQSAKIFEILLVVHLSLTTLPATMKATILMFSIPVNVQDFHELCLTKKNVYPWKNVWIMLGSERHWLNYWKQNSMQEPLFQEQKLHFHTILWNSVWWSTYLFLLIFKIDSVKYLEICSKMYLKLFSLWFFFFWVLAFLRFPASFNLSSKGLIISKTSLGERKISRFASELHDDFSCTAVWTATY